MCCFNTSIEQCSCLFDDCLYFFSFCAHSPRSYSFKTSFVALGQQNFTWIKQQVNKACWMQNWYGRIVMAPIFQEMCLNLLGRPVYHHCVAPKWCSLDRETRNVIRQIMPRARLPLHAAMRSVRAVLGLYVELRIRMKKFASVNWTNALATFGVGL